MELAQPSRDDVIAAPRIAPEIFKVDEFRIIYCYFSAFLSLFIYTYVQQLFLNFRLERARENLKGQRNRPRGSKVNAFVERILRRRAFSDDREACRNL